MTEIYSLCSGVKDVNSVTNNVYVVTKRGIPSNPFSAYNCCTAMNYHSKTNKGTNQKPKRLEKPKGKKLTHGRVEKG